MTSFIDDARSICLCEAGLPGYVAAVAIAADGRQDLVLARVELLDDARHTYNASVPEAGHEQAGPLPERWQARVTYAPYRCGRPTRSGSLCRVEVARPGRTCHWDRRTAANAGTAQ